MIFSLQKSQSVGYEISDLTKIPQSPLVSVLMLSYNHEAYVRQAIDSILEQKVDFIFEIVIGEDCSTDRTKEILLEYQSQRPDLFRIISADVNVGMNANYKRAHEACRGMYIAFCETDDYWVDEMKLKKQVDVFINHPEIDLVFHSTHIDESGFCSFNNPKNRASQHNEIISTQTIISSDGQFIPTASMMIRADSIRGIPQNIIDAAPFIDFITQILSSIRGGGYYIDAPMSVYRRGHLGSWSSSLASTDKLKIYESGFYSTMSSVEAIVPASLKSSFDLLHWNHFFPRLINASKNNNNELRVFYMSLLNNRSSLGVILRMIVFFCRFRVVAYAIDYSIRGFRRFRSYALIVDSK